jgi:hypothetical protein
VLGQASVSVLEAELDGIRCPGRGWGSHD